jgi:hypothetical protein
VSIAGQTAKISGDIKVWVFIFCALFYFISAATCPLLWGRKSPTAEHEANLHSGFVIQKQLWFSWAADEVYSGYFIIYILFYFCNFCDFQTQESVLQGGLEDMYSNMNNETFRSMRRIMPITRTKMEWNVNAVRMVRQVRK